MKKLLFFLSAAIILTALCACSKNGAKNLKEFYQYSSDSSSYLGGIKYQENKYACVGISPGKKEDKVGEKVGYLKDSNPKRYVYEYRGYDFEDFLIAEKEEPTMLNEGTYTEHYTFVNTSVKEIPVKLLESSYLNPTKISYQDRTYRFFCKAPKSFTIWDKIGEAQMSYSMAEIFALSDWPNHEWVGVKEVNTANYRLYCLDNIQSIPYQYKQYEIAGASGSPDFY